MAERSCETCRFYEGGDCKSNNDLIEAILRSAKRVRMLEKSPKWKTCIEDAIEEHGDACEDLWGEVYALLDEREKSGNPVQDLRPPPDKRKELRKMLASAIKDRLPGLIDDCISGLQL